MKVFTWLEIAGRRIPLPHSFVAIGEMLREELESASCVLGAQIIGSMSYGQHSVTSDIDVVVVYSYGRRVDAIELVRQFNTAAHSLNVPLQIITIDDVLAVTAHHHIRADFAEHFALCLAGGPSIKIPPSALVHWDPNSVPFDTINYLVVKLKYFEEGEESIHVLSDESRTRLLGKALSFPVHAVRKLLQCFGETFSNGDSRGEVIRLCREREFPDSVVFEKLLVLADEYRMLLITQVDHPDEAIYRTGLRQLEVSVPLAYEYARTLLFSLASRFGH